MTWQNRRKGRSKKGGKLGKSHASKPDVEKKACTCKDAPMAHYHSRKSVPIEAYTLNPCDAVRPYDAPSDVRCALNIEHMGQHLGYGPHGEPYLWTQGPGRCPSTPPPTKFSAQQCDQLEGHAGEHWFDDGMTKYEWSVDHMTWCGLDTDHTGNCWPADPDPGVKEPGPHWSDRILEENGYDVWDDAETGADTVPCGESLSETTQEGTEALKRQALTDTVREAIVALSTLLEEIA